jgi:uncharacterized protein (DUF1800 family)
MGIRALRLALFGAIGFASAYAAGTVTISPTTESVHIGAYYRFSDTVTGITPTTVGWSVALPAGATGSPGTIDTGGLYVPPAAMPSSGTVIVTVASNVTPSVSASATVTLLNPVPIVSSVIPTSVGLGAFTITVNGSAFVPGAIIVVGNMQLPTTYVSATKLTATFASVTSQMGASYPVTVINPDPGSATSIDVVTVAFGSTTGTPTISYSAAARFLDQAAWGGDAATIAHVQDVGFEQYLKEQFSAPISPYPDPTDTAYYLGGVQSRFFSNAVNGPDQLRQRVAFALLNQFVVSAITDNDAPELVPYLQILQNDAFANFRTVMEDVSLSPTMGLYLNMVNNDKANATTGTAANENYARELMQLFTIGLSLLNPDGTPQLDSSGNLIPTYGETTIQNFAKVYTGWTYPTESGATLKEHNPAYFVGPMVVYEANHDTTSKTLLNGLVLPAGQTAQQDLQAALDNIFAHQNIAPFVSKQLIQHLVTSNPSPAYVERVALAFNNDGTGVKGNLAAVVKAILLDNEARAGDQDPLNAPATGGKLREPVFYLASMMRGLGATVNDANTLTSVATNLGQQLFYPPSVFNYFAPSYQIPLTLTGSSTLLGPQVLLGPEFQLQTPSSAVGRYNTVNTIIYGSLGAGAVVDLTPFTNLGNNPTALFSAISNAFFYGQMPAALQSAMQTATTAITGTTAADAKARAQAALYLGLSSAYYNVEH